MPRVRFDIKNREAFDIVKAWAYRHEFLLQVATEDYKLWYKNCFPGEMMLEIKIVGDSYSLQAWAQTPILGEMDLGPGIFGRVIRGPYRKIFNELLVLLGIPQI